jgi:hypothetical protein
MAKKLKLKVMKVSEQTSNGNFIHSLQSETGYTVKVFGQEKTVFDKYLIALPGVTPVNTVEELDMSQWEIMERTSDIVDATSGEVRSVTTRWLHIKRG